MIGTKGIEEFPTHLRPVVVSLHNTIVELLEENRMLKRLVFQKKCEEFLKLQKIEPKDSLFPEAEELAQEPEPQDPKPRKRRPDNSGGRVAFPEVLERVRVVVDLPEAEKICPHDGSPLEVIGERVVEKLEIVPARFYVVQYVTPQFACIHKDHMAEAKALPCAIPQGSCEPGLLAHIISEKYVRGLPLYRLEQYFQEINIPLSRTTLARWVIACADVLGDIAYEIKKFILSQSVIHADETTVQVLQEPGKKAQSTSYMWTLCTSGNTHPAVWYQYEPSRSKESAKKLLGNYSGLLHVDGYSGYDAAIQENKITPIGCWAHARRKFNVSFQDGAAKGKSLSGEFLSLIQDLFLIEREIVGNSLEEKMQIRKEKSQPVLDQIQCKMTQASVLPTSKLGIALTYLKNQWNHLNQFMQHPHAELSNNRMENFIRPFAIGRKNWLFSNSTKGADASAILYTIVQTARANKTPVEKYLHFLLKELPIFYEQNSSHNNLTQFLPWNCNFS